MNVFDDPNRTSDERLAGLADFLATNPKLPTWTGESNNHIHTCYSFSPYTPTGAALRARQAGLQVAGSVDHDSLAAAAEMRAACAMLQMGVVTGFEIRAKMSGLFAERKLNNPDSVGVAYLTVQGVPSWGREKATDWLRPIREARKDRTFAMARRANELLADLGLNTFDLETDLLDRSQFANGGTITERHLLAAIADVLISSFGRGAALVNGVSSLGLSLNPKIRQQLSDETNPYLTYDLLGVLKAEYLERIYLQPDAELPTAREVVELADSIGAVAAYAYLGDVGVSKTQDKKSEHFEDAYLDELFDELARLGFRAVTYMPPRNSSEQLSRVHQLACAHKMLEISGVDINQPRQSFSCPELRSKEFAALNDATWALAAHETLSSADASRSMFSGGRLETKQLTDQIATYSRLGKQLVTATSKTFSTKSEVKK